MNNKVCPLSFISASEKVKLCIQKDCMFWNEIEDDISSCLLRDFLGWHNVYLIKAISHSDEEKKFDKTLVKREHGFSYG